MARRTPHAGREDYSDRRAHHKRRAPGGAAIPTPPGARGKPCVDFSVRSGAARSLLGIFPGCAIRFCDRAHAGRELAEALATVWKPPCVVAAIPRGGVSVAMPIVERFRAPLTVVYARKLTAPIAPEFAFGALDEDGHATIDARSAALLGLPPAAGERAGAPPRRGGLGCRAARSAARRRRHHSRGRRSRDGPHDARGGRLRAASRRPGGRRRGPPRPRGRGRR